MPLDLLTFGEAIVEVMRPAPDLPLDAPGAFVGPYPSGAPFIFAVQAAKLGAQAGVIGCVGADHQGVPDAFGRCLLAEVQAAGVDVRGVRALRGQTTGVAFISYAGDGSRDYVFHMRHAASGGLTPNMLDEPDVAALFVGLKCLHITGSALALNENTLAFGLRAIDLARAQGAQISFDPNLRPQLMPVERARAAFAPVIAAADVILPTVEEALLFTGAASADEAADRWVALKPDRLVVMTDGERGCIVYAGGTKTSLPIFPVETVDPTGAGDCFDAGFLVQWLSGADAVSAARYGNACGALAVTARGPMAGIHAGAAVEGLLGTAPNQPANSPGE